MDSPMRRPMASPWNCMQATTLGNSMGLLKGSFIWALALAIPWTCHGSSHWGVHGLAEWLAHWDATMGACHGIACRAPHWEIPWACSKAHSSGLWPWPFHGLAMGLLIGESMGLLNG